MSTPSSAKSQQEGADPIWVIVLCLLAFALVYIVWSASHTLIATGYGWIRIAQFGVFKLIHSLWAALAGAAMLVTGIVLTRMKATDRRVARWFVFPGIFLLIAGLVGRIFASWFDFFWGSDASLIEFGHLTSSSMYANGFTLLVFIVPGCVWIARRSLGTNPLNHNHFARPLDYTLHSFSDEMGKHYPHVRLFRKLDLTSKPIDSGKYRMPDAEKQFVIDHGLLDRHGATGDAFKVNRDRAAAVFRAQTGKLWRGFNDLSKWEVAVLSVLIPRVAATDVDMPDAEYKAALEKTDTLLAGYWESADRSYNKATDMLDVDVRDGLATIRKYYKSAKVQKYFKKHAYVYSILYAMLADARSLGVLPADEFRWLRVVDRRLWLVMNNVGRNTAFTEIAGLYCHYLHEAKKARPLEKPEVDNAVKGLIEAIDGYKFSDEEIAVVNSQLKEKEAGKDVIDPTAVVRQKRKLYLGALRVREGEVHDFLEVALVDEGGQVVYEQRCQPKLSIEAVQMQYHLDDADVAAVLKQPVSSDIRKKLIELVNGHSLIAFYRDEVAMVPGIDRSAADVTTLEDPNDGADLQTTVMMEEVVKEPPSIRSAVIAAQLVRQLWVAMKKAEMRAAQASSGASTS